MYNRYIPQNDGSFRRQSVSEPKQEPCPAPNPCPVQNAYPNQNSCSCPDPCQIPDPHGKCGGCSEPHSPCPKPSPPPCREPSGLGIRDFFRNLFPRGLDTGDLMVILLLLLISQDCQEDQNTALLTLALYLFL